MTLYGEVSERAVGRLLHARCAYELMCTRKFAIYLKISQERIQKFPHEGAANRIMVEFYIDVSFKNHLLLQRDEGTNDLAMHSVFFVRG